MSLTYALKQRVLTSLFDRLKLQTILLQLARKRTNRRLVIDGRDYPYLFHSYNNLGLTERSVEMPLIYHYLTTRPCARVLEIGNVTNYYADFFAGVFPNKTVVDKIEKNYNVITSDIAQFQSPEKFDFIFSVSTFEHMDSDLGRNPDYVPGTARYGTVAADNIVHCYENLLADGGFMVITAPIGYTPEWDATYGGDFLRTYPFRRVNCRIFGRVSEQEWVQERDPRPRSDMKYDHPFPFANYVSVIEIEK